MRLYCACTITETCVECRNSRQLTDFCHTHGVHKDAPSCPACGIQEKLDEALLQIELLENTINDLNLRVAFLES